MVAYDRLGSSPWVYLYENTGAFRDVLSRDRARVISDAVHRSIDEGVDLL